MCRRERAEGPRTSRGPTAAPTSGAPPASAADHPRRPGALREQLMVNHDGTYQQPVVRQGLESPRRFQDACAPTASNWLTLVGRGFRAVTATALRRGAVPRVPTLFGTIAGCLTADLTKPGERLATVLETVQANRVALAPVEHHPGNPAQRVSPSPRRPRPARGGFSPRLRINRRDDDQPVRARAPKSPSTTAAPTGTHERTHTASLESA